MFVSDYYQQKDSIVKLSVCLEVLQHVIKFQKIFLNIKGSQCSLDGLIGYLRQQAKVLNEKKNHLFLIFERKDIKLIFEELKQCELFWIMVGCIFRFQDQTFNHKWTVRELVLDKLQTMSEVTSSVDLIVRKEKLYPEYADDLFEVIGDTIYQNDYRRKISINNLIYLFQFDKDLFDLDEKIFEISKPTKNCWKKFGPNEMCNILKGFKHTFDRQKKTEKKIGPFIMPQHILPFLTAFGYKVSLTSPEQWLNYIEINILHRNDEKGMKSTAWMKINSSDSASLKILTRWEDQFLFVVEKLHSMPLTKLDLVFLQGLQDPEEQQICQIAELISSFKSLQHFRLVIETSFLTTKGLKFLAEALKRPEELKELNLSFKYCPNLTDEGILSLGQSLSKLPALSQVTLGFYACVHVTQKGVENLLSQIPPIKAFLYPLGETMQL